MTGLHDKRATSESRRAKRPERSKPESKVAEPPARRAKRAESHVPLRKRESARLARPPRPLDSDLEGAVAPPPPPPPSPPARRAETPAPPPKRRAARVARPPRPLDSDSEGAVASPPPPARRVEAPAPPPKPEHSVPPNWHRTAYRLRNRVVRDTSNRKLAPSRYDNGIEIKHDPTWQTPTCARVALEHYNNMNQGDEHEMVKPVSSHVFVFNGIWFHANFLAKRKGATNCVDLVPKYFFAESEIVGTRKISCVSCVKLDPANPKNIGGCSLCSENILHPAGGGYHGAQARSVRHAPGGLQISFKF
ncbi:unnamed protein product [Triticum turgidum subsp. durum]|uniref:DUF3615 domain-containing protein n=1 Tax=Triticum turgidum subsp. durum TaxID=4567 RepID=A0A9R0YAC3_TRITD|nr:unnamed protein product [Triticum turgidum subsp. durum]